MTSIRQLFGFIVAVLALAAFAVPAAAQQKVYSLNMAPPSITSGAPAAMTATFKNETPNGNSTINSMSLTAPTGLTITAASIAIGNIGHACSRMPIRSPGFVSAPSVSASPETASHNSPKVRTAPTSPSFRAARPSISRTCIR